MAPSALTRALTVVRAAVRMRVILSRQRTIRPSDPGSTFDVHEPLLPDEPNVAVSRSLSLPAAPQNATGQSARGLTDSAMEHGFIRASADSKLRGGHGTEQPPPPTWSLVGDMTAIATLITASYFNILLLTVPLGIVAGVLHWSPAVTFTLNFMALIPLALILGDVTEDLAMRFGDVIGGLLNATFGNIVELILSIAALERGLYTVVATSLVGSILSNLLLVLGCCFLFGGMYYKVQTFNATSNRACSSLLLLSSIGVAIPSAAGALLKNIDDDAMLMISRGTAIILLACYICYLYFQLYTHSYVFDEEAGSMDEAADEDGLVDVDEPMLSTPAAVFALAVISVMVAVHSEYLTGSIENVSLTTGLSQAFLGMIVLPIAGNACEHMAAVVVAMKNKMELSLGIAIGSSLQIALCVLPVVVLVGWATGHDLSLNLDLFIVIALLLSVVHANMVTADASSHWLMGVSLIAVYLLIAIAYYFQ